ncbi:MAG: hypothetical protein ACRELY_07355 [Polyangiaceae bacterium]
MSSLARIAIGVLLCAMITSCAAAGKSMKSSVHATCADSCNNVPADTMQQCIAQCTE